LDAKKTNYPKPPFSPHATATTQDSRQPPLSHISLQPTYPLHIPAYGKNSGKLKMKTNQAQATKFAALTRDAFLYEPAREKIYGST